MRASQADRYRLMLVRWIMNMSDEVIIGMCRDAEIQDYGQTVNVLVAYDDSDGGYVKADMEKEDLELVMEGIMNICAQLKNKDES